LKTKNMFSGISVKKRFLHLWAAGGSFPSRSFFIGVSKGGPSRVSNDALLHIGQMPGLVSLRLSYTDITDAGMTSLAGLAKLEVRLPAVRSLPTIAAFGGDTVGSVAIYRAARLPELGADVQRPSLSAAACRARQTNGRHTECA
jgi:hypothetical protein